MKIVLKMQSFIEKFAGKPGALRHRLFAAGHYSVVKSLVLGAIEFARTVVFSRVLTADDYGLMALAAIGTGLLESFSATGINLLILRDDDKYSERLPAYWGVNVTRGAVLAALAWFIAEPLGAYYGRGEVVWLVRVLSITFILRGAAGFGVEIRQRELNFRRIAIVESLLALPVLCFSLLGLFLFRDVRALVCYQICAAAGFLANSYVLRPWKPVFRLDSGVMKAVARFGGSIVAINILLYFFNNFDRGVLGKLFGTESLGFYVRGHFLALLPVSHFANVIAPIFMPAFREVMDDTPRLRRIYIRTLLLYAAAFGLLGAAMFFAARWIVLIVYGARWLPVIPVFRVLLICGMAKGIVTVCPAIFFLRNKPWMVTLCAGVMAAVLGIACVPLASRHGALGVAWAVSLSALVADGLAVVLTFRLLSPKYEVNQEGGRVS